MKRFILTVVFFLSIFLLFAQKDTTFYKHEVRGTAGPSFATAFWLQGEMCYANFSVAYLYRPVKWFWVGGIFVNYFGDILNYKWREYRPDGSFRDFSKDKIKYCAAIAPEIRFSYLNKKGIILYAAFSAGIALEDGYDSKNYQYPKILPYLQITFFGLNCNFGINKNIFLGGEVGFGVKGIVNIHGGYRF